MQKLFDELAKKANSEDAVDKATVANIETEIKSLRNQISEQEVQLEAQADALARKSSTKSQTNDSADDLRAAQFAFVKGRHAVTDGDIKADEFSRTVDVEGGHTIPTHFDSEITRALNKTSSIRALSRVLAVSGNLERIIKFKTAGVAKTKAEKAAYELNTVDTFAKLRWNFTDVVDQQRHTAWVSDEPESVLNLAQELQDSIVLNIGEKESDLLLNGTILNSVEDVAGVTTTPMGLLAHTLSTGTVNRFTDNFGTLAKVEVAADVKLTDAVLELRATLHSQYLANAVLVVSSDFEKRALMEKDENGRPLLSPSTASVAGLPGGTIRGIPYVVDDLMPSVAEAQAAGKPVALLADFKQAYTIADYGTMKWVVDPITEPQFVKYTARRRVGAAITNYKAIRALVITAV
ncbi:phage major capsid protein [Novosphingobium profundi]|uniref:phage major capsid protein n=1 Tax=Novosphingobium profundi TaxID=1774954 RepID=UPI001BDB4333|nr:phage major capsid protein [Novosphingobium profundi]MBT0671271.1 phage major capsid protein [Novosphingobium profundi]